MSDDLMRRYGWALPGDDHCHAGSDGECMWSKCPQIRDGEPEKSGRHCPLDRAAYEGERTDAE